MQDYADHIIAMLLPVIAQGLVSFKTLNILARTNKTLALSVKQNQLHMMVAKRCKHMTKKALRQLFVLPASVRLSFLFHPSVYTFLPIAPRCNVSQAFGQAMVKHGSVVDMANAFHTRQRKSISMKLAWKYRKELIAVERQVRVQEIEQIRSDLCIIPCSSHIITDTEMIYVKYGVVRRLSRVYRNKRLMALHNAGLLYIGGGVENSFLRVARLHMNDPDSATHTEKLFILRHSLAWEHFLYNYTSFNKILREVAGTVMDVDHVEFLFTLPTKWPFSTLADEPTSQEIDITDLPGLFAGWIGAHDFLYEDPLQ
jgi:hypothetical protein